jgi:hypothetical protein
MDRAAIAGAAALIGLLASGDARAGCTKDDECKGARICDKGRCVDPPGGAAPEVAGCRVDSDCAGEDVCADRRCVSSRRPPSAPLAAPPPPALPVVPLVPVTVMSKEGAVMVTVSPSVGGQIPPCAAPCTLQVPAGSAYVDARLGEKGVGTNVSFAGPSMLKVQFRGSLGPPIAVTVIGSVAFFAGLALFADANFSTSYPNCDFDCNNNVGVAGATLMGVGGAMALVGAISFAFVGKNEIQVLPGGAVAFAGKLRVGAIPTAGGAKSGLALSF